MATVCVDPDDFTVDSNGRLQIKLGCGLSHSENGIVHSTADTRSAREQVIQDTDIAISSADGGNRVTPHAVASITNPSNCRSMLVQVIEENYHEVSVGPRGAVIVIHERQFDSEDPTTTRAALHQSGRFEEDEGSIRFGDRTNVTQFRTLGPGATLTVRTNLRAQNINSSPVNVTPIFTFGTVTINLMGHLI